MDYRRIHDQIINRSKIELANRIILKKSGEYFEAHHIIPRCRGGDGTHKQLHHENIALLTAKEHYIIHLLLTKIYPNDHKIYAALWCMITRVKDGRFVISSKTYESLRKEWAIIASKYNKGKLRGPMSEEHKRKISESSKGVTKTMTEARLQADISKKGIPLSAETKKKLSDAKKGRVGVKHTEETKKRLSEIAKNRPKRYHTEETKKKLSKPRRPMSDEVKKKISETRKKLFQKSLNNLPKKN
jgi:hypothetical protein